MDYLRLFARGLFNAISSVISHLVGWLSFSNEIESMVDAVNHRMENPPAKIGNRPDTHPGGFARILGKRRLNMASSYIKIANDHAPEDVQERLTALRMLMEESLHAKTINMPLNTSRVQISLMKEVVKSRRDRRRQMEAMTDFGLASFGHESVIRDFLNKHNLIEVPEEGKSLRELDMGWDDHVHDFLSEGRKTPTQVLLDAFVKGISRLTLVHSTIDQPQLIHEAISAGNILGIEVRIGIEFSVGRKNLRRHYMFIPPVSATSQDFFEFFSNNHQALETFLAGLKVNSENRRQTMVAALDRFNTVMRPKVNTGYSPDSPGFLHPLTWEEIQGLLTCDQVNRVHLAELIYQRMKRAFHSRVLELKTQVLAAEERFRNGMYSEWEMTNITSQYEKVRKSYETMSPDLLMAQYLDNRDVLDYDSAFPDELPLLDTLREKGGNVLWIHPLEMGLSEACFHLVRHASRITHLETVNLRENVLRNPDAVNLFSRFVHTFNNLSALDVRNFFDQNGIGSITIEEIEAAREGLQGRKLIPVCGSDSTGRDPAIPGMGFIKASQIPCGVRENFKTHHYRLARPVAQLILAGGNDPRALPPPPEDHDIICMGKIGKPIHNLVGDEPLDEIVGPVQLWNYLNPALKGVLRVGIGLFAAYLWMGYKYALGLGIFFSCLWFFITGFRNFLVDMIASSGSDLRSWTVRNVNFDNLTQSLFWTGFSVPLLGQVKDHFDLLWPWAKEGMLFEGVKFLFICVSNGIYITFHNRLRRFDKKVIRANFFRTILAWPFATAFSSLGNSIGIPSIVQAKFWSDFVGGLIEGRGKFKQRFVLRQRDLRELLPRLNSYDRETRLTSMLDILFIWGMQPRGKTCLGSLLMQERSFKQRVRDWWFKREASEELIRVQEEYFRCYLQLFKLFMDPGCLFNLTKFILQRFSGSDAVALTGLVGDQLEPFRNWLRWVRTRFEEKKPDPLDAGAILPPSMEGNVPKGPDEGQNRTIQPPPPPTDPGQAP